MSAQSELSMSEEFWIPLWKYPGHYLSSHGRVRLFDEFLEPYLDEDGLPSIHLRGEEWEYRGPIVWLMLKYLFIGKQDDISIAYADGDDQNLDIDNIVVSYPIDDGQWQPIGVTILSSGMRSLDRRIGKKIQILETGQIFNTVKECADAIGGSATNIYAFFRGVTKSVRGYTFRKL